MPVFLKSIRYPFILLMHIVPWQRGSNNIIPKRRDMAYYSDEYLQYIMDQIHSRPRKIFNWKSEQDVYNEKCSI